MSLLSRIESGVDVVADAWGSVRQVRDGKDHGLLVSWLRGVYQCNRMNVHGLAITRHGYIGQYRLGKVHGLQVRADGRVAQWRAGAIIRSVP